MTNMLFPVVYLIQRPLSIFWVFQPLEHYLVIMYMQLILLQGMVLPSNWVPTNKTSFGIMSGMSGILCTAIAKLQNYLSMSVMAISQIFAPKYIISSLEKCTLLSLQPIISTHRLVTQHIQMVHMSCHTPRDNWTVRSHITNSIVL